MSAPSRIAIVGAGRIGSTFACFLGRAGHEVTVIARGARLEELTREPAIETVKGERVAVKVAGALDETTPWDLLIVTVLAHQVDALLPSLAASRAKTVLFMFNTFQTLGRLRDAVGAERFAFGFPMVTAFFVNGKLKASVRGVGKVTTVSHAGCAEVFKRAGLPAVVETDMESWLRSHVAFIVPLMLAGHLARSQKRGVTWAEARRLQRAMRELFAVVRTLGHSVIPRMIGMLSRLPSLMVTSMLWLASRSSSVREVGGMGPGEVRTLIDAVVAAPAAPDLTPELRALRP